MGLVKIEKSSYLLIKSLYLSGKTTTQIAKLFNVSRDLIVLIINSTGIKIRNVKYFCDENYFNTINTENKAYFLGLMISDGCNIRKGLKLSLQEEDGYMLEKFKQNIQYTGKLYYRKKSSEKRKNSIILQILSKQLSEDLTKLGCIPAKSHFTYFPDIPEELQHHFIRGVFDGDGCITININNFNSKQFSIIGNITLIEKIQEILIEKCELNKTKLNISTKKGAKNPKNIVTLAYGGNKQTEKIREYLYKDATIFLQRKYNKFFNIK